MYCASPAPSDASAAASSGLRQEILRVVQASTRPLSFREIRDAYRGPRANVEDFRKVLHICVAAGAIFPCACHRYWHRDEKAYLLDEARGMIERKPLNRAELARALAGLNTGAPLTVREQVFEELASDPSIHAHPDLRNARSYRLSTQPPKLADYVGKARKEYLRVVDTLKHAGFDEGEIALAVCGLAIGRVGRTGSEPRPLSPPREESDLDFQRDAAELLAYAWNDAESAEARELIEDTLYSLGLNPVGKDGDVVEFDGRVQHLEAVLEPGQKVQVLQPGWELANARGTHLILKARVQPFNA